MRCDRDSSWLTLAPLGALATTAASLSPDTSPRGHKRSRSPDTYGDLPADDTYGDDGMYIPHARWAFLTLLARSRSNREEDFANEDIWRQVNLENEIAR